MFWSDRLNMGKRERMKKKEWVRLLSAVTATAMLFTASPVFAEDAASDGSKVTASEEGSESIGFTGAGTGSESDTVTSAESGTVGVPSGNTDAVVDGSSDEENSGDKAAGTTVTASGNESENKERESATSSSATVSTSEEASTEEKEEQKEEEKEKEKEKEQDENDVQGIPSVSYSAHVQRVGWQDDVVSGKSDSSFAGTAGQGLRVEAIRAKIAGDKNLGITYNTYVQHLMWTGWQSNGANAGTTGKGLRVEAIAMKLTGEDAEKYDLYYRVHVQSFGWLAWAKNGETAGTADLSRRIEAYEVALVKKGEEAPARSASREVPYLTVPTVTYQTHVQRIGWSQGEVSNGAMSGTMGRSLRMEALKIHLSNTTGFSGGIAYRSHVQRNGWETEWKEDGAASGTEGSSLRLEAVQIRLTGELANYFDVYYRTHIQRFGWSGWASNGAECGSSGYGYRLEAIEIRVVPKGHGAPGSTANAFHKYTYSVRDAYPLASARLDQVGWNLRSAMNAAAGLRYVSTSYALNASNVRTIANYGFTTGGGDCYVMACCFYEMAKALGYDAHVMFGYVPLRAGGLGVHSWVEIDNYQGATRVFDPDFQHESGSDGFNLYYGKPGTWRYTSGSRIN